MTNFELCIVIPCYNEASLFALTNYQSFLTANKSTFICFVNDGSTDTTQAVLNKLQIQFSEKVHVIHLDKNGGKAEAVRTGISYCYENVTSSKLGFIDADLAVSLEESVEVAEIINTPIRFVFGSRILRIGSVIERKTHRFLIGRFMATLISNLLDLKVYDTQCGCKMFDTSLTPILFTDRFTSKWLFDVELFFRMKKHFGEDQYKPLLLEVPLKKWIDGGDSKVRFLYGFQVFFDLYRIKKRYK